MSDVAIAVRGVTKRYQVFDTPWARLRQALWPRGANGMREIQALEDVTFDVARGESLAVIGRNGGGKSTLLEILTGTLVPTAGEVKVNGRVSALLELGSGFNPEYSGRDNVMLNGLLAGFERGEILRRFPEIEAFAEIGEAIDRPVKTYSSGMMMRLAFAVQVLSDPDILIIDEALSVGDFFFQQKCFARIRALRERGVTLVFVSHDMGTVRDLCDRAVYLKAGRVQFAGETVDAIRRYLAERGDESRLPASTGAAAQAGEAGEFEALLRDRIWTAAKGIDAVEPGHLMAVALYDERGAPSTSFRLGETMTIKVAYRPALQRPTHVTAVIRNKYDQVVTSIGSSRMGLTPPPSTEGDAAIFEMRLALSLEAGSYSLTLGLAEWVSPNRGENLDLSDAIGPITIHWDYENDVAPFLGMFGPAASGIFKAVR
jgi:lipopolysaccharide transport system ATP-binding protein